MRTRLFVGGCAAIISCQVNAQSSVSIYGSLDAGIDYVSNANGKHLYQESVGRRQPDRWGFLIREDLGGGNAAFARLESGFSTNTGAQINPNSYFNRESYLGLSNERWGSVTLGNMHDMVYEFVSRLNNAIPGISSFYSPGNLDGLANTHAMINAVRYETISYNGFQAGAMNGFGNQAGDFGAGRQYSVGAQYDANKFKFGVGYTMSHDRTADIFGIFGLTTLLGQKLQSGTMFNAQRYSTVAVGTSYQISIVTPHATYTNVKLANANGSASMNNYQVGANIDLSHGAGADILGISYSRSTFQELTFNQYNLFFTHYLSKRTQIYAGVGMQRASGPNAHAEQFNYPSSNSSSQTVGRIGVNHMF